MKNSGRNKNNHPVSQKAPSVNQKAPSKNVKKPVTKTRSNKKTVIPADRLAAIERRKSRSRAIGLSIFVLFIMLITILLIIAVMQQARPRPRFIFITEGKIDHVLRASGLILRDEEVIEAPAGGLLKPVVIEGSRIASNQKLAVIIPAEKEAQLKELQKTERDMVDLQLELMQEGREAGARAIYTESNASLLPIINLIRQDSTQRDLSNLDSYSASIEVILEQRTAKLMTVDFSDPRLIELRDLRSRLELSLGMEAGTLTSHMSGLVSYKLDGREETLNLENMKSIVASELEQHLGGSGEFNTSGQKIEAGQPVLRIISNIEQIIMFILPATREYEIDPEKYYSLNIPSEGLSISGCRLVRSEQAGEDLLVAFQTDRLVERFADRRILEAELILSSTSGLKVPAGSLLNYDPEKNQAELMIVSGGFTRISKVRVIDSDRENAIVESWPDENFQIGKSTVLVINPEAIEAGEYIGD